jgi:hypothetical protein
MSQRVVILTIVLFSLIVAGMFGFSYLKRTEIVENTEPAEVPEAEVKYASISRIDAKHFFIDGVHTLAGEIPMPTPCELLETNTAVAESYPEQVQVDFTVINNTENCVQMITPARFKAEAVASAEATFTGFLNGRPIELNLIPAAEGETPEDFEIFIKG